MSEKEVIEKGSVPVYSSSTVLTREKFRDFCTVNFHRSKIICIIAAILMIPIVIVNLVLENFGILPYCMIYPLCLGTMLWKYERLWKIGYEKRKVSFGKDTEYCANLNEENISVSTEGIERNYSYAQITGLYETESFLMLHLKLQLFIAFEKEGKRESLEEIKQYVLTHCHNVKKKKFIDVRKDRTICVIVSAIVAIVCLVATVISLIAR